MTAKRLSLTLAAILILIPTLASTAISTPSAENKGTAGSQRRQFTSQSSLMDGTAVYMTVIGTTATEGSSRAALSSAISRIQRLNTGILGSDGLTQKLDELGRGNPLTLSPDEYNMLSKAVTLAAQTRGWFDITAPSTKGWFTRRDWRRIDLDAESNTITLKSSGMKFDLERFAKGYMVDLAMNEIKSRGISDAMVRIGPIQRNTGRDIFTPWSIKIDFGNSGESKFAHRAFYYSLPNLSTATATPSGLGQGLIDAQSKKIVTDGTVRSVTTIAIDASTATANAIAVYTLGTKNGIKYMLSHPEVKGVVVDQDGDFYASTELEVGNVRRGTNSSKPYVTYDGGSNDLRKKKSEEAKGL
jgi:FAD:protein FMN transferase